MKKIVIIIGCYVLFIGCGSLRNNRKDAGIVKENLFVNKTKDIQPTMFWAHYDASQRSGLYLVYDSGNKVKVISENPPDAVLNSTIDALAKVKVGTNIDVSAQFSAIKSLAELGQRSAANYMIRDIAFRIEALKNNNNGIIDEQTFQLYCQLMQSAEKICIAESKSDDKKYEAQIAASNVELAKIKLEMQKLKRDSICKTNVDTTTSPKKIK